MKLFAIRDTTTNQLVKDEFFKSKPEAKRRRDQLNLEAKGVMQFVVTPGPDHRKFASKK